MSRCAAQFLEVNNRYSYCLIFTPFAKRKLRSDDQKTLHLSQYIDA